MKNKLITGIIATIIFTACRDNNNTFKRQIALTTDSVSHNTVDSNILIEPSAFVIRADNTYVDLETGRKVKLRVDSISRDIIDDATNQLVPFFIDPSTNDTFDTKGRKVNNALIRANDSSWMIDETKLKVK